MVGEIDPSKYFFIATSFPAGEKFTQFLVSTLNFIRTFQGKKKFNDSLLLSYGTRLSNMIVVVNVVVDVVVNVVVNVVVREVL